MPLFTSLVTNVLPGIKEPSESFQSAVVDSVADALTAHSGGTQAPGTPITTRLARFSTVAASGDSALLPSALPGMEITVINSGANPMNVFPASGEKINGGSANAAFSVTNAKQTVFRCTSAGNWYCALSN